MARRSTLAEERYGSGEGSSSRSLRPLAALLPYVGRYKGQLVCAGLALIAAAGATLAVPLAVRRMIDFGFSGADTAFVDRYFGMLIVVVATLAAASALRYYFVTWLGERIVADLRADVFAHITRLSPAFFDREKSGEVTSRLTADATQIKSAVGASASIAALVSEAEPISTNAKPRGRPVSRSVTMLTRSTWRPSAENRS